METTKLSRQKGKVIVPIKFLYTSNESLLRELFSNFFPIAIDHYHKIYYYDSVAYLGFSPHFEEVEEACIVPEYTAIFVDNKFSHFDKAEKALNKLNNE